MQRTPHAEAWADVIPVARSVKGRAKRAGEKLRAARSRPPRERAEAELDR